jgi:hypothetical protein
VLGYSIPSAIPATFAKPVPVPLIAPIPTAEKTELTRRRAIAFMLDAFDAAEAAGIEGRALSQAALFQAIMRIVEDLGEEEAAKFLRTSARGVQSGYYTRADCLN